MANDTAPISQPPAAAPQPSSLVVVSALLLDLAALALIAFLAKWHTFSEGVTAGAFFTVITGQVASKAGANNRARFQLPGIGVVLAFFTAAYTFKRGA